jgi:hypothetical protein
MRGKPRRAALADWLQERGALEGMVAHADSPKEMAAYLRKRGLLEGFIERARSIGAWGDWACGGGTARRTCAGRDATWSKAEKAQHGITVRGCYGRVSSVR